jgi:hypothetical protein
VSPYRVSPALRVDRPAAPVLPDELGWMLTVAALGALRLAIAWNRDQAVDVEVAIALIMVVVAGVWTARRARAAARRRWRRARIASRTTSRARSGVVHGSRAASPRAAVARLASPLNYLAWPGLSRREDAWTPR